LSWLLGQELQLAAFCVESSVEAGFVVIRNEDGRLLVTKAARYHYVADVLTAKLWRQDISSFW
jgi:hypothetical protein